jgi:glycerol-3-phosphate dehydrogenase (NAD(P)+)
MRKISVIGAGAWGTALAMVAGRAGRDVCLQAREVEVASSINEVHENTVYLPGFNLDPAISALTNPREAVSEADAVLLVTPAQHVRAMAKTLSGSLAANVPVVICAKGIEQKTSALMSEIVEEILPGAPLAVLSGPTFAAEVASDMPTAVTLACKDEELGEKLTNALATPHFRIYRSDDITGAEIGGAVKNVLAIACGVVEGRNMGDNTRAALVTRGLAEIVRLGVAKGAKAQSLMGLAGIGDLTLTCNALQSRNYSLGVALGEGQALNDILGGRNSVAEGVFTAASVTGLALELGVEVPICSAVNGILNEHADIDKTIADLLNRPFTSETL